MMFVDKQADRAVEIPRSAHSCRSHEKAPALRILFPLLAPLFFTVIYLRDFFGEGYCREHCLKLAQPLGVDEQDSQNLLQFPVLPVLLNTAPVSKGHRVVTASKCEATLRILTPLLAFLNEFPVKKPSFYPQN